MSSSLTQKWLRQAVNSYPNQQRVYADVDATLARFSALRPKSDVYTFDDGRTQLLLCVHGLLPITFRGASYNIQMAIWVTRDYPRQPPIAYVVPTNDILVRPGKYVDVSGRCNIEYLQHWERKAEGCSLSALLEAFQDYFSLEPPVYSKPKDVVSSYANRPPPPLPSQSQSQSQLPPPLPSKPPIGQRYPPPHIGSGREIQSSHVDSPPPVPPPPALPQNTTQPQIASPPYVVSPSPQSASDYPPRSLASPIPPPPPPPPFPAQIVSTPIKVIPDLLDQEDDSVPAQSSSFSSLPPRPPNPELLRLQSLVHQKLTSELNSLSEALALDAERLRAQQADLLAGEPAIKDEMSRLEAVRDVCLNVANRTRQAVQQAESNIAELRRKGDPEVDELVCATTIVHDQLINLIADDNAIEDTIYHLHRALNAGRIDLERFLRSTRVLAEEQFMKRALIEKIQSSTSSSMAPDWA